MVKALNRYRVSVTCLFLALCTACMLVPRPMRAADTADQNALLPDAAGKDTVVKKCTQCHDASQFAMQRKSGDDWSQVITQMNANGLTLTDEEEGIVLDYLTKNLGPNSPVAKVNVNKATSADLQKALGITPVEADAITKFRTDHGAFKDWHGVASVDGVDAKKIEAKKDSMVF